MTTNARMNWSERPRCFDSDGQWMEWKSASPGWRAPCADCTPEHRERMRQALRCCRPEVVFVRARDGEVSGLTADDPRYARLLMGLDLHGAIVGRTVEMTEQWVRLMEHVKKRAHREVKRAMDIWFRRVRKEA